MDSDRVVQFTQAYRNLQLFPLLKAEEIEKFRIPYGQRTMGRLKQAILAAEADGKLIFTGHRGCGKSTLLAALDRQLVDAGLFVSRFSMADTVELSDVNYVNILYAIALQLLSQATKQRVPIPEKTKMTLTKWFTQTKSRTYTEQLGQEFSAGADLYGFITGKLQTEHAFREEIRETYQRRISDLSKQIDLIAAAIQTTTQKEVLVMIDDLDKLALPAARSIFGDNIRTLMTPNIRVVFTIPIAVIREPTLMTTLESESDLMLLSVTKFFPQAVAHQDNPVPIEENVTLLEEVLKKRIPDELMEPETRRKLVLLSGGVLRELVRLAQECCQECLVELDLDPENTDIKINDAILQTAAKSLRNQFARALGSNLYDVLVETYKNFTPPDIRS
ncbi:MAG: ATP-binding protein, partial [Merismopedia sp. SIO2A8]|nr:ATP-binding protein [Merismopedia sp. SIO2A8]